MNKKGFTLVELLVVIAIIAILSSVAVVNLNSARKIARDAIRKSDLKNIALALQMYYEDHGHYIEGNIGCGYNGFGMGWFNHVYTPHSSIVACLIEAGYLSEEILDPSGDVMSTPDSGFTYMKYHNTQSVCLYAKLESEPQDSTATDGTCNSSLDSAYGLNYYYIINR